MTRDEAIKGQLERRRHLSQCERLANEARLERGRIALWHQHSKSNRSEHALVNADEALADAEIKHDAALYELVAFDYDVYASLAGKKYLPEVSTGFPRQHFG